MVNGVTELPPIYFLQQKQAPDELPEEMLQIGQRQPRELTAVEERSIRNGDAPHWENSWEKKSQERRINPEDLVLKPSEVPLEVRLKQVVSLETIQTLLLLRSPYEDTSKATEKYLPKPVGMQIDRRG